MKWTTKEDDCLRAELKKGKTYQEIAAVMTRSRGAIASRIKRLKIINPKAKALNMAIMSKVKNPPVSRYKPRPYVGGKLLADLKIMECHFPHEGQVYCGERAIKPYGYCETHQDICYTKNTCKKDGSRV